MSVSINDAWSGLITLEEGERLVPLRDAVFIRRDPVPEKVGLIDVAAAYAEGWKQQHGTVMAVGPGKRSKKGVLQPCDVSVGDRVMFDGSVAREFSKDRDIVMVVESEIFFVLSDDGDGGGGGGGA